MILRRLVTLAALFPSFVVLAAPVAAWARAGGGQGYGGGDDSGGFSGGGGGLWSLWPLLFLGHGSGFGTIVLILIVYYLYQQYTRRQAQQTGSMVSGGLDPNDMGRVALGTPAPKADPNEIAAGIAAIKAHDPNFDEAAFLDRAQTAFFKLQQAWQARNQDLARDVMSDAIYERHKMQTDQLLANHQIDMLENIVIGHANIVGVNAGHPYDSIVVSFSASMTDYTIDENTKQVVSGNQYPKTFTERWTFIRRADAQSAVGATQLANTCPSCGAPLSLQNGRCTYCGAFVRTASSDWVVDSIEQTT